jgi:hypothetical protein
MAKVLPLALAASIATETILSVRHSDGLAPQPHIESEISVPFATTLSLASSNGDAGESVEIIYGTPSFPEKNWGNVGQLTGPVKFYSIEAARKTAIPEGYNFARIVVEGGYHVWTTTFGWEYHEKIN